MTLIDMSAVAAIKARKGSGDSAGDGPATEQRYELTPARARRLTDRERADAIFKAFAALGKFFEEIDESAPEWFYASAQFSGFALDLMLYASQLFASPHPDPRKVLRERVQETLTVIAGGLQATLEDKARAVEAGLRAQAEEKANALLAEAQARLDEERQMLTAAADTAQQEATAERRRADALEAEAKAARQEVNKVRYDADRAQRQRVDDLARLPGLEQELADLRRQVMHLEAHNTHLTGKLATAEKTIAALEDQLTAPALAPTPVPAPEESPMPRPARARPQALPAALAAHSFVVFLRAQGHDARLEGGAVFHSLGKADHDRLNAQWRAEVPTKEAAMQQLRAVVLPIVGRVA